MFWKDANREGNVWKIASVYFCIDDAENNWNSFRFLGFLGLIEH